MLNKQTKKTKKYMNQHRKSIENNLRHGESLDIVKALSNVVLQLNRRFRKTHDLNHIVVGNEVEARKDLSLSFEVHVQRTHNHLQSAL